MLMQVLQRVRAFVCARVCVGDMLVHKVLPLDLSGGGSMVCVCACVHAC